jgi:hypothetical protein
VTVLLAVIATVLPATNLAIYDPQTDVERSFYPASHAPNDRGTAGRKSISEVQRRVRLQSCHVPESPGIRSIRLRAFLA